ncbi:MAG: hypothetical protein AB1295_01165 [Candidatus Micrarchaeota archaeon]
MNATKLMGIVLGVIGVALMVGGIYLAMSYMGAIVNVMIGFVATNGSAMANCGVTVPEELVQLKDQVATTILPGVYLGIPLAVIVISLVMFTGGYFYGKGALQDQMQREKRHKEEVEQEVEKRVMKRGAKTPAGPEEREMEGEE